MYVWNNEKIRSQYDLQIITAKNNKNKSFTADELHFTTLNSKEYNNVTDPAIKHLIELAYIRGRLDGLRTADEQLEDNYAQKAKQAILKTDVSSPQMKQLPEQLYFIACKVKNRQDKTTYVSHCIKARSESEAVAKASTECGMKNQTLLLSKIVKTYPSDTMQFQFGIGNKEQVTLMELGKKYIR